MEGPPGPSPILFKKLPTYIKKAVKGEYILEIHLLQAGHFNAHDWFFNYYTYL